jgi:hypothetical protein
VATKIREDIESRVTVEYESLEAREVGKKIGTGLEVTTAVIGLGSVGAGIVRGLSKARKLK